MAAGAEEIDMVISREAFLAGEDTRVMEEIVRVKEACGDAHLKVILETAELGSYDHVRHASMLAMEAGADFIKTSTGKAASGATPGVTLVMLEAIRDYAERSGRAVGMKAAGGVSTSKAALHRLVLVKETLGDEWLTPDRFRIGASSLLNDLLMQYEKTQTGPLRAAGGLLEGMSTPGETRAPESSGTTRPRPSRPTTCACATATACSSAASSATRSTARASNRSTRPPRSRWPRWPSQAPADVRRAVESAARAAQPGWAALSGLERGKYLFRVARLIQERARELAVVESLDGGKPIRESRDVDVPLAAAHFFHYAGWADKLSYGVGGRAVAPSAWRRRSCPGTSRC